MSQPCLDTSIQTAGCLEYIKLVLRWVNRTGIISGRYMDVSTHQKPISVYETRGTNTRVTWTTWSPVDGSSEPPDLVRGQRATCEPRIARHSVAYPSGAFRMSSMITFAANNEFFRKRKRA